MNKKILPCCNCLVFPLCRGQYLNEFVDRIKKSGTELQKGSQITHAKIMARSKLQKKCELLSDYIYHGYTDAYTIRRLNIEGRIELENFFFEGVDIEQLWKDYHA